MPSKLTSMQALDGLLPKYEPSVANAFRVAMASWRDRTDVIAVKRALTNGDLEAAVKAMHLTPAALNPLLDAIERAYEAGGVSMAGTFPTFRSAAGARYNIAFNSRDPIAADWLQQNSAAFVSNITSRQNTAIQNALAAGRLAGDNPSVIALDIVGRIGLSGRREGGVIGLSVPQGVALSAAKIELASNDPTLLRNYLTRELRDKRFDRYVSAALEGNPIPEDIRTKMVVSYSNKLLKLRGDTIAVTETLPALHASQTEAVRQAIAAGAIRDGAAVKFWDDLGDNKVRHSHSKLGKGKPIPLDTPFVSELGNRMMFPGDKSLGAGAEDIVHCRCRQRIVIRY